MLVAADIEAARLCLSLETDAKAFDYVDTGAGTGVCFGIKHGPVRSSVTFRGSMVFADGRIQQDWFRDCRALEVYEDPVLGMIHAGFREGMPEAFDRIRSMVGNNPDIYGHSYGASHACILAAMTYATPPLAPNSLVLFGCPRVGDAKFASSLRGFQVRNYKNRLDPVTDVPFPLPGRDYVTVWDQTMVDGMVDYSLGPPWDDHHLLNYIKGFNNAGVC